MQKLHDNKIRLDMTGGIWKNMIAYLMKDERF